MLIILHSGGTKKIKLDQNKRVVVFYLSILVAQQAFSVKKVFLFLRTPSYFIDAQSPFLS